jgi:hypothetical protein
LKETIRIAAVCSLLALMVLAAAALIVHHFTRGCHLPEPALAAELKGVIHQILAALENAEHN